MIEAVALPKGKRCRSSLYDLLEQFFALQISQFGHSRIALRIDRRNLTSHLFTTIYRFLLRLLRQTVDLRVKRLHDVVK